MAVHEPVELERKLQITPEQRVALINVTPSESVVIPMAGALDPELADVVIGFVAA